MQLPAPNCQVMSFISSKLIFPKIRITFRVFQWAGSYGNAITGLIPADLFEKKHTKRLQNYGKKLQNVLLFFFEMKIFPLTSWFRTQISIALTTISMNLNQSNHHPNAYCSYCCRKFSKNMVLILAFGTKNSLWKQKYFDLWIKLIFFDDQKKKLAHSKTSKKNTKFTHSLSWFISSNCVGSMEKLIYLSLITLMGFFENIWMTTSSALHTDSNAAR